MSEHTNFDELFTQSIGIREPWYIERSEFSAKDKAVHIYIAARKGAKYACNECGGMLDAHDYEQERIWQHGDVVFRPCYIHCRRPRVKCPRCGKIHVADAPWARFRSRYTLLFEAYAMELVEVLTVEEARKFLRISHTSLTNIVQYYVWKKVAGDNHSGIKRLNFDETSFKRGQSYVTVACDSDARRVIGVEDGRSAKQIWEFSIKFEEKGGDCNAVEQCASDMCGAYLLGISAWFPNAIQVVDRFHVKKLMLGAMDEVRREEQGRAVSRSRKSGKKLLMIPQTRQSEQQAEKVAELCKAYPKTGRAFRMVQALDMIYTARSMEEADGLFDSLYRWLRRSRLMPMKKVALTLQEHKKRILAYFVSRLTNAIAEGINSLIQAAKRKARGFRTFKGFATMIYLQCSKLDFPPIRLFV